MSLIAFQELFANIVADPALCKRIKYAPELLRTDYDLTEREAERISHIILQRGMVINCMLYQINRFTPLFDLLPYTCKILSKEIKIHTREFWDGYIKTNFQFRDEVLLFAAFLLSKIEKKEIDIPYLEDVVNFEITYNYIRFKLFDNPPNRVPVYRPSLRQDTRMVYMQHDLRYLIDQVIANPPGTVFTDIPVVNKHYLIKFTDRIDMEAIDADMGQKIENDTIGAITVPDHYRLFFGHNQPA